MKVFGKQKRWAVNVHNPPSIEGQVLRAMGSSQTIRYLGLEVGALGKGNLIKKLQLLLDNVS